MPRFASWFVSLLLPGVLCGAGCAAEDFDGERVLAAGGRGSVARGRTGDSGAGGAARSSTGEGGASGNSGAAGQAGAGRGSPPPAHGGGGNGGSEASGYQAPNHAAGADPGFCQPTVVVMLPLSAKGEKTSTAKVQVHADTTGNDLGEPQDRYRASCAESDGDDLLIGLDVPSSGELTVSLTPKTPAFQGVLSVERDVCVGTAASPGSCAAVGPSGIAKLTLEVDKGDHLFVFVDTTKGHGGEFDLVATLVASP